MLMMIVIMMIIASYTDDGDCHHDDHCIVHRWWWLSSWWSLHRTQMMMIVIMMIIASYTDDDDRHHDNDCMQARVLSCTPAAAAPIENRIILSVGAAAAVIFPGDILLMGAAVAGADKGTMGLGYKRAQMVLDWCAIKHLTGTKPECFVTASVSGFIWLLFLPAKASFGFMALRDKFWTKWFCQKMTK